MSAETLAPSVNVRDTADRDTPASSATLLALTEDFFGLFFGLGKVLGRFAQVWAGFRTMHNSPAPCKCYCF